MLKLAVIKIVNTAPIIPEMKAKRFSAFLNMIETAIMVNIALYPYNPSEINSCSAPSKKASKRAIALAIMAYNPNFQPAQNKAINSSIPEITLSSKNIWAIPNINPLRKSISPVIFNV